jgi:methylated-DNA-[protein]-cysteine S-methyltransferase
MLDKLYIGQTGKTTLGRFWLAASEIGLVSIVCGGTQTEFMAYLSKRFKKIPEYAPDKILQASVELHEYLIGQRKAFTQAVDWSFLRQFQRLALRATCAIPYGETRTYKEIAWQIGSLRGARAVGRAEATNPLPLVIPCHRVIGTDGKLHGYGMAEGLKTKAWLLKMEGAMIA